MRKVKLLLLIVISVLAYSLLCACDQGAEQGTPVSPDTTPQQTEGHPIESLPESTPEPSVDIIGSWIYVTTSTNDEENFSPLHEFTVVPPTINITNGEHEEKTLYAVLYETRIEAIIVMSDHSRHEYVVTNQVATGEGQIWHPEDDCLAYLPESEMLRWTWYNEYSDEFVHHYFIRSDEDPNVQDTVSGELAITFDYDRISGSASNQYAIWIEDMVGNYINTVFATRWTAAGGFNTRPDSIAIWVDKSDISSMPEYYVDAISGATPQSGTQTYIWDLLDINGETVPPGDYKFFVEGTLRWKNYVLYSGTVSIGNTPMTVHAVAEYNYETSDRYDALTNESPENMMIGTVTASFTPAD